MANSIIVIAEHFQGAVRSVTVELTGQALNLAEGTDRLVRVVVLGSDVRSMADEIARTTGVDVIGLESPKLAAYIAEGYLTALAEILPDLNPDLIMCGHTTQGLDFAPALAVRLGVFCITGVEAISRQGQGFCFTRAAQHGKVMTDLDTNGRPAVITVQPGAFAVPDRPGEPVSPGSVEVRQLQIDLERTRPLGVYRAQDSDAALGQADVIVAAGRGAAEHLELAKKLAEKLTKATIAGSRPVCDAGLLPYKRQVGLTGATVAPKLYIALGISGARQHTVGMSGSGFVVAVSTDPNAAIFNLADVVVVEDVAVFVPALIEVLEKYKYLI